MELFDNIREIYPSIISFFGSLMAALFMIHKWRSMQVDLKDKKNKSRLSSKKIDKEIEKIDKDLYSNLLRSIYTYLISRLNSIKVESSKCNPSASCIYHRDKDKLIEEFKEVKSLAVSVKKGIKSA